MLAIATVLANAAAACFPLDEWRPVLDDAGMTEVSRAVVPGDQIELTFVSPDGQFARFYVDAQMTACLIAKGTNFHIMLGTPG